ncbi:MAG TPA: aldo/keto reductase [Spirochaetota bacterium]|nr:aldo/keto reductase [Spirochaetota bacterium]
MIYREYGSTGKMVSALGFGGMRFKDIKDIDTCASMMLTAARGGINYFDTAPKYFGTGSEEAFAKGLAAMRNENLPYYLSTKTDESHPDSIRREIEAQLKRLDVNHIDFYHIWCITSLDNWRERKKNGVLETFIKLKEEGLIKHICVSSHLIGDEIKELLMEEIFEGVLFGYSAYNFKTRQSAFDAITERRIGCVVMNPLGGGIIPGNPEIFRFLQTVPDETVVQAALRFLFAHQEITISLVGFETEEQVNEALAAANSPLQLSPDKLKQIKKNATVSLEGICTGCQYCDHCPVNIPIPKYMDAYNQKILTDSKTAITDRLFWHWSLKPEDAAACIECGRCEEECTQHLNIIERLKEISVLPAK